MPTDTSRPTELTLDVSADLPFSEPAFLAASVHLPAPQTDAARAVLICWPGGSYGRSY
jgi:hypothetical protein